jgi:hypothetical protein
MRFILNFIFYGCLFYLLYLFFPDAFKTLVSWVQYVYDFCAWLVQQVSDKINFKKAEPKPEHKEVTALFLSLFNML